MARVASLTGTRLPAY